MAASYTSHSLTPTHTCTCTCMHTHTVHQATLTIPQRLQQSLIDRQEEDVVVLHLLTGGTEQKLSHLQTPHTTQHTIHYHQAQAHTDLSRLNEHSSHNVGAVGLVADSEAAHDGSEVKPFIGTDGTELEHVLAPTLNDGAVTDLHLGGQGENHYSGDE